ncbi:MAG: NifU family protein [Chlorobi bacterium]|nr:NifU family protein [Chlorobiota bacterium]
MINKITEALDLVRPFLNADGGDISFIELTDDMTVKVKLLGACQNCTMNIQTLKSGVEHTIKKTIPEIKEVISVDEENVIL